MESKLLVIVGPTASGKSALAMKIAKKLDGEIICADSQTIRRDLNIGTAKPTAEEQKEVRHHLLDIIDPYDTFSVADFKTLAIEAINDVKNRGKLPILVGGSGLYIDSVVFDFNFRPVGNLDRSKLDAKTTEELQQEIKTKGYAMPLNSQNKRHLIRTLESGGLVASNKRIRDDVLMVGLNINRDLLRDKINLRINKMISEGFIDEVKMIIAKYGYPPRNFDAIGYKIVLGYMDGNGEVDAYAIKSSFATADYQYSRRQTSWLKRNPHINWFEDQQKAYNFILSRLK